MARPGSPRRTLVPTLALVAAAAGLARPASADAPVVRAAAPVHPAPAPSGAPVYGGWTSPSAGGGYGTWTTPRPAPYGTWTTPPPGGYGTWTTQPGAPRASASRALSALPASVGVAEPSVGPPRRCDPCGRAFAAIAPASDGCPGARAWGFGAFARAWRPTVAGDVLITLGGEPGTGTRADVEDDLGIDDASAFEVGASVAFRRHRLSLAWEEISASGDAVLDEPLVYRGVTFAPGERVESDLTMRYAKAGYDHAWLDGAREPSAGAARWDLRTGVAAWWWRYRGRLEGTTSGTTVARSFSHVLPVATVEAGVSTGRFRAGARASGGLVGEARYLVDVEASVGVRWKALALDVGYRYLVHAFDETTNEAELRLHGPFVGLSLVL